VHQLVKIIVADGGLVVYVVAVVMFVQLASQLLYALFLIHGVSGGIDFIGAIDAIEL
jgi:hypothetical protein